MTIAFHGFGISLGAVMMPTIVNITSDPSDSDKPVIVYDLDGTLVQQENSAPRWDVIEQLVSQQKEGAHIAILTERLDNHMVETVRLLHNIGLAQYVTFMFMRPAKYEGTHNQFKEQSLGVMVQDGMALASVVDDDAEMRSIAEAIGLVAVDPQTIVDKATQPKILMHDGKTTF